MINIISPINPLGYGVAGLNITKHLARMSDVSLWPIGNPEATGQDDIRILSDCINKAVTPDFEAPCLRIWHQNDMSMFVGRGEKVGFPFFELNEFNEVEKHHLNSLDRLFVSSTWAKHIAEKHLTIKHDKINVINLGVDTSIFRGEYQPNQQGRNTVFFNCGKWEIRKGHDILVKIFNEAFTEDDDVELWMMTRNPFLTQEEDAAWRNLYSNSKLGDKIKFIDRVATHEEVYNTMTKVDCGVFPSRAEGWNLELLEMMSCGKQVIATNYSAHTEFCNDQNSMLVDITDTQPAFDGKWFDGKGGSWAKISETEFDIFVDMMKTVHENHRFNKEGVETANNFSWRNTAQSILSNVK